jgi:hypothetical protein
MRFGRAMEGNSALMRIKRTLFVFVIGFAVAWFADPVSGPRRRRAVKSALESRSWSDHRASSGHNASSGSGFVAEAADADSVRGTVHPPIMDDPEVDIAVPSQRW